MFVLLVVALFYAFFWVIDRRNTGGSGALRPRPPAPKGPEDDEDFLRDLEFRRRREQRRGPQRHDSRPAPERHDPED